jgi:hypothetical protein
MATPASPEQRVELLGTVQVSPRNSVECGSLNLCAAANELPCLTSAIRVTYICILDPQKTFS